MFPNDTDIVRKNTGIIAYDKGFVK